MARLRANVNEYASCSLAAQGGLHAPAGGGCGGFDPSLRARGFGGTGRFARQHRGGRPGVTVEPASPALIERTRTVVTDGEGRYRIVDLRPGIYTVTFALEGFKTGRRE